MSSKKQPIDPVLLSLRNPQTIRQQAHRMLALAKENQLEHFVLDQTKMESTASLVIDVITHQYPQLNIPYHSRWRHFEINGIDRIKNMMAPLSHLPATERGKMLYELVIISVLLDAGAGALWRYQEIATGREYSRSEGLAIASLALYQRGVFSAHPSEPYRVDAQKLLHFKAEDLQKEFQVDIKNPLDGIVGRVTLLNQLGTIINQKTEYFGTEGRLGDFYSYVSSLQKNHRLSAQSIFQAVLSALNTIWPTRLTYQGVSLGDVWIHKALKTDSPGSEYIPFHKLSQWLTYSLIEPLEQAEIQITEVNKLTGLPEYRNGGLLIDTELLTVKNQETLLQPQDPGSEVIVEWRALTVALLDELAVLIRKKLNQDEHSLPLAKILQGGTWEAGRQIAKQKRHEGTPPIQIISDGTVF